MADTICAFKGKYAYLSNFYPSRIEINGRIWPTLEHVFQAAKTESKEDQDWILHLATPGGAKRFGRIVSLRPGWEEMKYDVMLNLVREKFKQNSDLMKKLLSTGDALLAEGNYHHDNIWGICKCGCSVGKNVGRNWLGLVLYRVRLEVRLSM